MWKWDETLDRQALSSTRLLAKNTYLMHTSIQGIEYDPTKASANVRKHGVSFADAEQVLRDPNGATLEDPDADGEARYVTLGMDAARRVLVVVWTPRKSKARVLSARKARRSEAKIYAQ